MTLLSIQNLKTLISSVISKAHANKLNKDLKLKWGKKMENEKESNGLYNKGVIKKCRLRRKLV